MLQYHPSNPLRAPDWRWERARIIRETGKNVGVRTKEDEWTKSAIKFQKDLFGCKDDFARYNLIEKYPQIYFAYLLHGVDDKKQLMRSEVEARILADESFEDIAERCGCEVETINLFEKLFFNVTDKLKNTTYILHQVMGPAIHRGMYEKDHDLLWKLYGYFCGGNVVDALTSTFTSKSKPETPEQIDALFVDDTRATMRRKAALAARSVGINEYTQLRILEIYAQFMEIEKDSASGGGGESLILENIKTMMNALPWSTGVEAKKSKSKMITFYDNQSAELRSDEILTIGAGLETDKHLSLANMKFPEAKSHGKENT